jgi:PAS domain S-box-containing protein
LYEPIDISSKIPTPGMKLIERYKDNLTNMMSLDIYLSSLSADDYKKVKHSLQPLKQRISPLMAWDMMLMQNQRYSHNFRKQKDYETLSMMFDKNKWMFEWNILFDNPYQAIVLTNIEQKILWVDQGFKKMTGYSKSFAIGKTPRFLQNEHTSRDFRKEIRYKLKDEVAFSERIVNYKKDKTEYLCEITIYPIKDKYKQTAAFIALENEII